MTLQVALSGTPTNIATAMEALGINVDRDDPRCQWHQTAELRVSAAVPFQFTIKNAFFSDPTTAQQVIVPADQVYVINVDQAHEQVYFSSGAAGTMQCVLLGTEAGGAL